LRRSPALPTLFLVSVLAAVPARAAEPRLTVTPAEVEQGRCFTVVAALPGASAVTRFLDRDLPGYPYRGGFRTVVGVALDTPPGRKPVAMRITAPDGTQVQLTAEVTVRAGKFKSETITLPPKQRNPALMARLQEENRVVEAALAWPTGEQLWNGAFRRPVPGKLTSPFGSHRVYTGVRQGVHRGVDLAGGRGTPVKAPNGGRVALARMFTALGGTLLLDHGQGVYSVYMHLDRLDAREGDRVEQGTTIAAVGSTGMVTGPHLHWGMIVNDARVDPLEWVQRTVAD
jgi:murein DD-endopeptidase MepM/ murein hydrolase activator NlpD